MPAATAQMTGEAVRVDEPVAEDRYLAGRWVEIAAEVDGDVVAAGQSITIGAPISQDLIAAGERLRVEAPIGDDLRAAGRRVELSADVGDHLVAAGDELVLAAGRSVGGFAWLAGNRIRLDGAVGGELKIVAREVRLNGSIGGDVEVRAERITLGPEARIAGDFLWRSQNEPTVASAAVVEGETLARRLPPAEPVDRVALVAAALLALVTVLVVGTAAYLVFPGFTEATAERVRRQPLLSPLLGLAVFAAAPVVIVILLLTGIGALLGLMLLALYFMALLLGWLAGAFCTGQYALQLAGRAETPRGLRLVAFLVAALLLAVVQLIPILGQLVGLAVLLFGLGGIVLTGVRRYRSPVLEL